MYNKLYNSSKSGKIFKFQCQQGKALCLSDYLPVDRVMPQPDCCLVLKFPQTGWLNKFKLSIKVPGQAQRIDIFFGSLPDCNMSSD